MSTVFLSGKIDTSTARQFADLGGEKVMVDCTDVTEISCEGLRLFLNLKDTGVEFEIVNVPHAVYHSFEVSGVAEMLPVSEKLMYVATDGLKMIGKGATADVYAYESDKVLKAYHSNFSKEFVTLERDLTRSTFAHGIHTTMAFDVVKTQTGYGAVYERIVGRELLDYMREDKAHLEDYVRRFGEFVREAHEIRLDASAFKREKDEMLAMMTKREALDMTEEDQRKIVDYLNGFPDSDHFVHGDCHAGNVMLCNGELVFIDIGHVCRGNPMIDFVSMFTQYAAMQYFGMDLQAVQSPNAKGFTPDECDLIWNTYLRTASGLTDGKALKTLEKQISILASVRILLILTTVLHKKSILPKPVYSELLRRVVEYLDNGAEAFSLR